MKADMRDVATTLLGVCDGDLDKLRALLDELQRSESAVRSSPLWVIVARIRRAAGLPPMPLRVNEPKALLELMALLEQMEEEEEGSHVGTPGSDDGRGAGEAGGGAASGVSTEPGRSEAGPDGDH